MVNRPDGDIEIERLQLRFVGARVSDERAVKRLMQSIDACGQLVACIAVEDDGAQAVPVLIDGYRRVAALRRLGRDTARVQCCQCTVGQALAQLLACAQSRALAAIEQALLLRELIEAQQLSQRDAARQCGRDVSWVQRRLLLLQALPDAVLEAVRGAGVSSWAAVRVFVPLARANSDHAHRLLASLGAQRLSTRELRAWFEHYQGAQCAQRERMVEHPRLFIDSLHERERERQAQRLRDGPERELVGELGQLQALLGRARRRLAPLNAPVAAPLARACAGVHAVLPEVASELARLVP
ncbi:ParB/RepB/Spo0J family partition protein [Roseateles saccharophilus]|uniref:ParB-like chromosome segregation protein Spo0J n=1 Tax=Roseateles saccharophilus TaxID=304 RepID=A0A4R3U7C6_ROSSA|nr:ParB N-terminal domain-containing protein [Roseateles saccharophilus]MDG0836165.1 chromosome partitioning protein ParB [Roseateles saccharophilus]TCU81819.1 ParB-like chromosome segregation protein Spo0J [Roseateles saccharophilus]